MNKKKGNLFVFTLLVIVFAILYFIKYGFAEAQQPTGNRLPSAPLPTYRQGTTFVYSDGSWETVVANSAGQVTWRDHRGYVSSGSADFTRRRAQWQTRTRQGTRQFEARKDLWVRQKTSLWPLQIGNVASYSETGVWQRKGEPENTYRANWACEVVGTERVSVMAGEFDTWKTECKRYAAGRVSAKSRLREIKTWYYAPEIGHYVLATRQYYTGKAPERLELLAVLPPLEGLSASAKRQLQSKFQKALESKKSGESLKWSLPGKALSAEIMPTGTFRLDDGRYSRRYVQILSRPQQGRQIYYGMAVRDSKGRWVIPQR
ncbi:MAG: hypothetical protein ACWGNO_10950 [Desulfobacterales bacterium]